ncbi:ExeA family protein [Maridesulfovibrio bastinii]|jgi:general secretion pathway protein A|uniref:ExeA family protein n=1 Tax=Maridesulfovibrio bastinii TaxID=47157 RepID=UPI00041BFC86|nr:AAA family ATPase [Maridesulfovibrio bastinii]
MYLDFYRLKEKPFKIIPDPDYFYLSPWHQQALTHIEYGLMSGDSLILLTGDAGTGKTSIIYKLISELSDDTIVGVLFNTAVAGDRIIEMILREFEGTVPDNPTPSSCLEALQEYLLKIYSKGEKKVLLVLDEAQSLSNVALEQVRMISNIHSGKENLLSVLMVGQSGFRARLRKAKYSQIVQRIVVSAHLSRLREQEVIDYIFYRLRQGGAEDPQAIFTDDALKAVYEYSKGIPRNINLICEGSLVYGFADDVNPITADVVEAFSKERIESGLLEGHGDEDDPYYTDNSKEYIEALEKRIASLEKSMDIVKRTLVQLIKAVKGMKKS